jgi:lycopene cyclase domain-containing protein
MTYSIAVVLAVLVAACLDVAVLRTKMLRRKAFWVAYAIVLFFQLLVNGLLTGLRIVRYDPDVITGAHLAYAPVEDLLFGFAMILTTLSMWVWLGRRAAHAERHAGRQAPSRPGAPSPPGPVH